MNDLTLPNPERWSKLLENPLLMDSIVAHVSNGGTVPQLCEVWNIPPNLVYEWIHKDPAREKAYSKAMVDREEYYCENIMRQLNASGSVDIRRLFNPDGTLKPINEWNPEDAKAVAAIEVDEIWDGRGDDREVVGYTKRIKLIDKPKVLELLGKQIGMFVQKVEHSGKMTIEDLVAGSRGITATGGEGSGEEKKEGNV